MQENLEDLNNRLSAAGEAELPMNRFRPNIVLAGGGAAWADDGWGNLKIGSDSSSNNAGGGSAAAGSAVLQYVKPCSRCKVGKPAGPRAVRLSHELDLTRS
jgi:uncharacterized protein YcbX